MSIEYVLVGFSSSVLGHLDRLAPRASVLILEEPDIIHERRVEQRVADYGCVAGIRRVPIHDESDEAGIEAVPRPDRIVAVLAAVDYGVVWAARLAERWRVPGIGTTAALMFRDKIALREGLAGELPQPRWCEVPDLAALKMFAAENPRGIIIKPSNLQGSVGIQRVRRQEDLASAWRATSKARQPRYRASTATEPRLLAEALVEGHELSVESLVVNGEIRFVNVTDKSVLEGPFPVESGHVVPGRTLSQEQHEALLLNVAALHRQARVSTGVTHSEWIVEAATDRVVLIECAGRLPGDGIVDLISAAYGFDFCDAWIAALRAEPFDINVVPRAVARAILSHRPFDEDGARRVERQLLRLPGVSNVHISPSPPQEVRCSDDRNCDLMIVSESRARDESTTLQAMALLASGPT